MQHRPYNSPGPGYLGQSYAGVKADGEDLAGMKLRYIEPVQFDVGRNCGHNWISCVTRWTGRQGRGWMCITGGRSTC
ncbi:MAG: hypothetical protein U0903_13085 [Planctomycetales bacterium]